MRAKRSEKRHSLQIGWIKIAVNSEAHRFENGKYIFPVTLTDDAKRRNIEIGVNFPKISNARDLRQIVDAACGYFGIYWPTLKDFGECLFLDANRGIYMYPALADVAVNAGYLFPYTSKVLAKYQAYNVGRDERKFNDVIAYCIDEFYDFINHLNDFYADKSGLTFQVGPDGDIFILPEDEEEGTEE